MNPERLIVVWNEASDYLADFVDRLSTTSIVIDKVRRNSHRLKVEKLQWMGGKREGDTRKTKVYNRQTR